MAEFAALWPLKRMPVLVDEDRTVVEATIIIEHLCLHHPGPVRLIAQNPRAALEVRMLDRFFDNYVMTPMQKIVADRIRARGAPRRARRRRSPRAARHRLPLARRQAEGARVGQRRPLHPGRLRGGARAVLRRLGASDRAAARERARLPQAPARAALLRARGGRGAAVPTELPARRARPRLSQAVGAASEARAFSSATEKPASRLYFSAIAASSSAPTTSSIRAKPLGRPVLDELHGRLGTLAAVREHDLAGGGAADLVVAREARARGRPSGGAGSRSARARRGSPATRRSSRSGTSGARRRRAVSPARSSSAAADRGRSSGRPRPRPRRGSAPARRASRSASPRTRAGSRRAGPACSSPRAPRAQPPSPRSSATKLIVWRPSLCGADRVGDELLACVPGHDHGAAVEHGRRSATPRHMIAPFQRGGPSSG